VQRVNTMRKILGNVLVSMAFVILAACGGGGGGGASAPAAAASQPASVAASAPVTNPPSSTATADQAIADRLYKGNARTPAGFDVETRPSNVLGTLSTRHLKNTDFATGPQSAGPTFEVCTSDMAQAIDWSERQATWGGQYSDLVEVRTTAQMFEIVRVPRADVTAMIRHRVFRCDYLDRSGTDLRADGGAAGSMNQRPLTAVELEALAEYLWQFTMFNNSDYAVERSLSASNGGQLTQTIRMGQLVRGAAGSCDTVQIMDWTHTMDATNGSMTRALTNVRTFRARNSAGATELCAG
jgi:hypothetical protein